MAILNFSDVLIKVGLDPKRVKLIRHSLADKEFRQCYEKGMVTEYTRVQSDNFSNGYDYWCVFISDMAVLAGLSGGSAQDVFIAVLSAGHDEESNTVLSNIKKFGNIDAFWQLVRKYTGYLHEDEKTLDLFAAHVLLTALAQTMNSRRCTAGLTTPFT